MLCLGCHSSPRTLYPGPSVIRPEYAHGNRPLWSALPREIADILVPSDPSLQIPNVQMRDQMEGRDGGLFFDFTSRVWMGSGHAGIEKAGMLGEKHRLHHY